MPSGKRARGDELDVQSAAFQSSTKRAKTTIADTPVKTYRKIERLCTYNHLLAVWSQPMTQEQHDFLRAQMKDMMKQKSVMDLNIFWELTSESNTIKKPLQLSTIKTILEAGRYSSVTDLCTDFKIMTTDVHLVGGEHGTPSTAARRLYRSFCQRMKDCPTAPYGKPVSSCGKKAIKRMEYQITNATTEVAEPSSEEIEVISTGSDEDEPDRIAVEDESNEVEEGYDGFTVSDNELDDLSETIHVESHNSLTPPEFGKILEPNDDLDEETRQLQTEIEERQQKLANIAQKKNLLAEIKRLDSEQLYLVGKTSEIEKECTLLASSFKERRTELKTYLSTFLQDVEECRGETERLDQEHKRLQQEIKRNQQCRSELRSKLVEYQATFSRLQSERKEYKEKKQQLEDEYAGFVESLERLEDRRTDAEEELERLNNGNI